MLLVVLYQRYVLYPQPSLATLMRSSELDLCGGGRSRALWLRDAAQSNLEQSLSTQWIDLQLAEAALVRHFIALVHAVGLT